MNIVNYLIKFYILILLFRVLSFLLFLLIFSLIIIFVGIFDVITLIPKDVVGHIVRIK